MKFSKKTSLKIGKYLIAVVSCWMLSGCGPGSTSPNSSADHKQELEKLRADNREVKRLRAENQELGRLRSENQEILQLRGVGSEILRLRAENDQFRKALVKIPGLRQVPVPELQATNQLQPIANLPVAFADAAIVVASQGEPKPEDVPKEGDNLLIDQSVIGLLIPEFQDRTNSGPYEISGWLTARGVVLQNYQQLNYLGITNYQVRRAPAKIPNPPGK